MKIDAEELRTHYRSVFSGGSSDIVLAHLCSEYWIFNAVHGAGDPLETAFRDGQRLVVLRILSLLMDPGKEMQDLLDRQKQQLDTEFPPVV